MSIYDILASKNHNPHQLRRYLSFLQFCKDRNLGYAGITEKHHICPKSIFPEYECFVNNPWNKSILTPRQHFIAHIMLEGIFGSVETKQALFMMSCGKWKEYSNYSKTYDRLRQELMPTWQENGKILGMTSIGMAVVKDKNGNTKKVSIDDLEYKMGKLVGVAKGSVTVKDKNGNNYRVSLDDPRLQAGSLVGVATGKTVAKDKYGTYYSVATDDARLSTGEFDHINKGMMTAQDKDCNRFWVSTTDSRLETGQLTSITCGSTVVVDKCGNRMWVSVNDPRLRSGELVGITKGTVSVKDNYGNNYRVSLDDPRYLSGELFPVTRGVAPKNKNKIGYTNGTKNIYLHAEDTPPDGYYKGSSGNGRTFEKCIICPHCGVAGGSIGNMNRWHFSNCKTLRVKQQDV